MHPLLAATMLKAENDRADAARPAQPSDDVKLLTLAGAYTGWTYLIDPGLLPPQAHTMWTNRDWINFIGNRWIRRGVTA